MIIIVIDLINFIRISQIRLPIYLFNYRSNSVLQSVVVVDREYNG